MADYYIGNETEQMRFMRGLQFPSIRLGEFSLNMVMQLASCCDTGKINQQWGQETQVAGIAGNPQIVVDQRILGYAGTGTDVGNGLHRWKRFNGYGEIPDMRPHIIGYVFKEGRVTIFRNSEKIGRYTAISTAVTTWQWLAGWLQDGVLPRGQYAEIKLYRKAFNDQEMIRLQELLECKWHVSSAVDLGFSGCGKAEGVPDPEPGDPGGFAQMLHGIGIAVCDMNGNPVAPYVEENGRSSALVLQPGVAENLESDGSWLLRPVPHLRGGKRWWTDATRYRTMSVIGWAQDPSGSVIGTGIGTGNANFQPYFTFDPQWTPNSLGRVEPTGIGGTYYGRYVFKNNQGLGVLPEASTVPPVYVISAKEDDLANRFIVHTSYIEPYKVTLEQRILGFPISSLGMYTEIEEDDMLASDDDGTFLVSGGAPRQLNHSGPQSGAGSFVMRPIIGDDSDAPMVGVGSISVDALGYGTATLNFTDRTTALNLGKPDPTFYIFNSSYGIDEYTLHLKTNPPNLFCPSIDQLSHDGFEATFNDTTTVGGDWLQESRELNRAYVPFPGQGIHYEIATKREEYHRNDVDATNGTQSWRGVGAGLPPAIGGTSTSSRSLTNSRTYVYEEKLNMAGVGDFATKLYDYSYSSVGTSPTATSSVFSASEVEKTILFHNPGTGLVAYAAFELAGEGTETTAGGYVPGETSGRLRLHIDQDGTTVFSHTLDTFDIAPPTYFAGFAVLEGTAGGSYGGAGNSYINEPTMTQRDVRNDCSTVETIQNVRKKNVRDSWGPEYSSEDPADAAELTVHRMAWPAVGAAFTEIPDLTPFFVVQAAQDPVTGAAAFHIRWDHTLYNATHTRTSAAYSNFWVSDHTGLRLLKDVLGVSADLQPDPTRTLNSLVSIG